MGTYLSAPVTEKKSDDAENDSLAYGASCMQGWRESQEDAHNCILDFDKNRDISLFAVYDGHGGAEVAKYAATNLPAMVKNDLYEQGEYQKALVLAYLNFDDTLVKEDVVEELTALREEAEAVEESDTEDDEPVEKEDELNALYHEANMPIEDLISKYKNKVLEHIDRISHAKDQPGSSKSSYNEADSKEPCGSSGSGKKDDDKIKTANGVEGSSVSKVNGAGTTTDLENRTEESIPDSSDPECGPSSSKIQNGNKKIELLAPNNLEDDSEDDSEDEIFHPNDDDGDDIDEEDADNDDEEEDEDDEDEEELDDVGFDEAVEDETPGKDSGCTAVMALLTKNKLYVANAGDSRCVISVGGKAHDMSKDHKPEDEPEYSRICAAGGKVSNDGRVNGGLNLSRALGDHNYKQNTNLPNTKQQITALPDVCVFDIKPDEDSFVVLACDGIWNSLSSQEVVDFVAERINKPDVKLSTICEELFDTCLAPNTLSDGTGCDNMTCIIVKIKHNQKRPRSDDEEDKSDEGVEKKKHKSDSIEQECVQ